MRALALIGLVVALGLAGCGSDEDTSPASGQTIEVSLSDFALDPSQISIDEPGTYTFRAVNDGQTVHALELEGHGVEEETEDIQPGETADLTVELTEAGDYELYCPVDDHRSMGMEGTVVVGGSGASGGGTTTSKDEDSGGSYGG
jgi:plastocyanin